MKFLISIYGTEEKWTSLPQDEMEALVKATDAHNAALFESGELLGAYGVAEQGAAKRVRLEDGVRVVTEGPYVETKEYLGSFYVVDCESLDRALEIAAEMPASSMTDIEVRPILHGGTADDF